MKQQDSSFGICSRDGASVTRSAHWLHEKTMWSIVYCPEGRCADFYFAENYEHSYGLILQEKGGFVKK